MKKICCHSASCLGDVWEIGREKGDTETDKQHDRRVRWSTVRLQEAASAECVRTMGRLSALKRVGRLRSKFSFEVVAISASHLPPRVDGAELVLQLARGAKIAAAAVDVPKGSLDDGFVAWNGQKITFIATLYQSKTGKAYSDKRYRASLLIARPVIGTSKRVLREFAHADINISEAAEAQGSKTIGVSLTTKRGGPAVDVEMTIRATLLGVAEPGDDDDDESISSAITGFSGRTGGSWAESSSEANQVLEQDLEGFGSESPAAVPPDGNPFRRRTQPEEDQASAASNPFGDPALEPPEACPDHAQELEREGDEVEESLMTLRARASFGGRPQPPEGAEELNPFEGATAAKDPGVGSRDALDAAADWSSKDCRDALEGTVTEPANPFADASEDEGEAAEDADTDEDESCESNPFGGAIRPASAAETREVQANSTPSPPRKLAAAPDDDQAQEGPWPPPRPSEESEREPSSSWPPKLDDGAEATAWLPRRREEPEQVPLTGAGPGPEAEPDETEIAAGVAVVAAVAATAPTANAAAPRGFAHPPQPGSKRSEARGPLVSSESSSESAHLKQQLEESRQQLEASQQRLQASLAEVASLRAETKELRASVATALADRDLALATAEQGEGRGRERETKLLAAANARTEAAAAEMAALREHASSLQNQADVLEISERTALRRVSVLEADLAVAKSSVEETEARLSMQIVESKLAAAQYAFERDELKQKVTKIRGGSKSVGSKLTALEVKYEELRQRYDVDMSAMIELRLQLAEANAQSADLKEQLEMAGLGPGSARRAVDSNPFG